MRNTILNLRKDAQASSLMAAELATENNDYLQQAVGGTPNQTDLYLAHFMGAGGAANFLKSMKKNPWAPAASLFPEAARSNRAVFYQNGKPLSLQAIYNRFDAKFQGGDSSPVQSANLNIYGDNQPVRAGKGRLSLYEDGRTAADALSESANWTRRNSIAQRIAASRTSQGVAAFTSEEPQRQTAKELDNGLGGMGFLRNPVQVMFMAQADIPAFAHNRSDRYNA